MNHLQQLERNTRLWHIEGAAKQIQKFAAGRSLTDYQHDDMLVPAVERQLMIIGEALTRAMEADGSLAQAISDADAIICLGNEIVHSLVPLDPERIWKIIADDLPLLLREVRSLLDA